MRREKHSSLQTGQDTIIIHALPKRNAPTPISNWSGQCYSSGRATKGDPYHPLPFAR